MSQSTPRITRSAAKLQADATNNTTATRPLSSSTTSTSPALNQSSLNAPNRKKRGASAAPSPPSLPEPRRTKRTRNSFAEPESPESPARPPKRSKRLAATAMSNAESDATPSADAASVNDAHRPSSGASDDTSLPHALREVGRRKSHRPKSKEGMDNTIHSLPEKISDHMKDPTTSSSALPSRKNRKSSKRDQESLMKGENEKTDSGGEEMEQDESKPQSACGGAANNEESPLRGLQTGSEALHPRDDPFTSGYLARFAGHSGLSNSLRALSGIVSGTHSRLRSILEQLRTKEDSSVQLIALQELSELLLVSNEDNLAGHFAPDQYIKELVALMQPNEFTGDENPEIMLLACRCIANMMEALPAATASVVYGGAVPVLCQKLLEIHFIDLAEQALSTLEKISVEFPSSIVREGGLTACLTYLDFFATSTQRTAVTTAANCCRNIPEDSFATVRDVMPILLTTLSSSDQRVVEQASLCVSRIIDSFKYHESKLEQLVSPELLRAILRLLLPGTTNMIGQSIHTQFLRVLSITARASPRLCVELLKMNVVDTLYQILTGVSPPSGEDEVASKIDKNVIMQAIIRTPRDQIFETLNVVCEILPAVSQENSMFFDDLQSVGNIGPGHLYRSSRSETSPNAKTQALLKDCPTEVKRFATILFPTLMHAYTSTVNLSVRQKVLTAQLKMLSNLDTSILEKALRGVTYSSHLASIFSQKENVSLVTLALQAAELLLTRLGSIYRPQFHREGVMAEISKLAERSLKSASTEDDTAKNTAEVVSPDSEYDERMDIGHEDDDQDEEDPMDVDAEGEGSDDNEADESHEVIYHEEGNDGEDDDADDDEDDDDEDEAADLGHDHSEDSSPVPRLACRTVDLQDVITLRAKRFIEAYAGVENEELRDKADNVLNDIQSLAQKLKLCYSAAKCSDGISLFQCLAKHFDNDPLESITSYELMTSGIVDVLLEIFNLADQHAANRARSDFLEVFMTPSTRAKLITDDTESPPTAFGVLVHKLQELLSRAEHFEVITVHHNAFESNRGSAASMLAKQLRLKLVADDDSGIPRPYRNIVVAIHAIATFKALDDYLRPRISLAERPRNARRDGITSAMAAYAAAMAGRGDRFAALPPAPATIAGDLPNRNTSKHHHAANTTKSESAPQPESSKSESDRTRLRRSTRKSSGQAPSSIREAPPDTPTTTSQENLSLQEALECADEAHISEDEHDNDDDDDDDVEAELDALVDDLDEGGLERDAPEPSAVNLEVANSGKVTARTEDGLQVSTPSQGAPTPTHQERISASARLAAARELLSTPTSSVRPMSYASALQQTPQDWHIQFSVNDQPIASDITIYRACHFDQVQNDEISSRNIWSTTHDIKFKKVQGPPPAEPNTTTASHTAEVASGPESGMPPSLSEHPVTAGILRLMSILHDLNANLDDVFTENKSPEKLNAEPASQFVNTKLTAKLNRQLEEPLIVASQCLPSWSEDLARLYPFLFPFETRHLFLQSTSFGYSRLMTRWQSSQTENESRHARHRDERPYLGRIQRQKVRISRSRVLESAIKVMELYGASSSILEVEYFEEVGTGLGPTLEFYSTVSKELSKKKTKLWRENESLEGDEYAFGRRGLFPAPMSDEMARNENGQRVLHLFKMLGKFVARSMLDSRIIDISFNPTFFRIGDGSSTVTPSLGAVGTVDLDLANSLKVLRKYASAKQSIEDNTKLSAVLRAEKLNQVRINDASIEDLGLDFTLPGYPHIELQPDGTNINVTMENVDVYVRKVIEFTLGSGVQRQIEAFQTGFSQVFPYAALKAFTPDELVMLFGRVEEDWSLETLMDSIKADHGYNLDSKSVRNLLQIMSELTPADRREFLQFVTGSPKLPIGGMLQIPITLKITSRHNLTD